MEAPGKVTTDYLKYFIAACDYGSIQEASKRLFISAQGLGQGIQKLERKLGVQLLNRTQYGVRPTQFGEEFYRQARVVCAELDRLEQMVEEYKLRSAAGLAVGMVGKNNFNSVILACANAYAEEFPDKPLNVVLRSCSNGLELLEQLRSGAIDVGLLFHSRRYPDFKYYTISYYSRLMLLTCADSPLARQESVTMEQLKGLRYIAAGEYDPFSSLLNRLCLDEGFQPNNIFFSQENNVIANLVDNGVASILLRESYYHVITRFTKNAVAVPVTPEIRIANSFITVKSTETPELRRFLQYMIDYFGRVIGVRSELPQNEG